MSHLERAALQSLKRMASCTSTCAVSIDHAESVDGAVVLVHNATRRAFTWEAGTPVSDLMAAWLASQHRPLGEQ